MGISRPANTLRLKGEEPLLCSPSERMTAAERIASCICFHPDPVRLDGREYAGGQIRDPCKRRLSKVIRRTGFGCVFPNLIGFHAVVTELYDMSVFEFAKDAVLTLGQKTGCSFPSVGGVKVIESSDMSSLFHRLFFGIKVESFPEIILERKALVDQVGESFGDVRISGSLSPRKASGSSTSSSFMLFNKSEKSVSDRGWVRETLPGNGAFERTARQGPSHGAKIVSAAFLVQNLKQYRRLYGEKQVGIQSLASIGRRVKGCEESLWPGRGFPQRR